MNNADSFNFSRKCSRNLKKGGKKGITLDHDDVDDDDGDHHDCYYDDDNFTL